MANAVPLNKATHKDLKVAESRDFSRFKNQHIVPVIPQDVPALATEFPIVFVKSGETGQFVAVALMGLKQGHNLYCQSSDWAPHIFPSVFTSAPLSAAKMQNNEENLVICIDEDSELVGTDKGEAIFDDNGEQTEYIQKRIKSVVHVAEQMQNMNAISAFFANKKLLVGQQLTVQHHADATPYTIDGVYTIDEQALNQLPAEEFNEIRQKGLLPIIYGHLMSLGQMSRLSQMQYKADS